MITTSQYIAERNPAGANAVFQKYTGRPAQNRHDLVSGLNDLGKIHGKKIAVDLMAHHPDKSFFNCGGDGGCTGGGNMNAEGDAAPQTTSGLADFIKNNEKTLILGVAIIFAAYIIKRN